ncbi:MAG: S-methyl-5-thioribose-1-phosphate isomerase [Candidatus Verstraetearchaeota archaeon]|nr:S-methyl-5-thioribose-1-phosphate isomerase [Candidatus Verstraetearchaeota archaeon]
MRTIEWRDDGVYIIDQTKLPRKLVMIRCKDHNRLALAIERMEIRGAPAIGVAAAMGLALVAKNSKGRTLDEIKERLNRASERLRATRPTARNLFWALERMRKVWEGATDPSDLVNNVIREADEVAEEDVRMCKAIGRNGATLVSDGDRILTYCNAGGLACVEYGTAMGVIRSAFESGKKIFVYAAETRPLLQGARLTTFELKSEGIPFKLITDNMIGYIMQKGLINKVVVGADRITRRGDIFNKIGTYGIALMAKAHGIPFYAAAPTSSVDLSVKAEEVIIEERKPEEVTHIANVRIAPEGVDVLNPAFDLTPGELVSGIITEKGVLYPPYNLSGLLGQGH